ncbi:nSTAND3 domain-containing NTPase [Streptomyces sp. NPDC004288]
MRDFSVLSDVEFEELAGDLLGAEFNVLVERFASGADGGIDLRWRINGQTFIGQCKHYARSSFSQLLNSAQKEVAKLLKVNPTGYRFITSFDLSPLQKEKIYALFSGWMSGPDNVLGGKDVDALITRHESVERRHPKLWVSTGLQLFWAVHADIANRTSALKSRIEKSMPKYVIHSGYQNARQVLETRNVCLISGPPGIGKTTLAQMLLAEHISMGYEPVAISEDINEAWHSITHDTRQIFIYDDFLGEIAFFERMAKNEDKRLVDLIERISSGGGKKLILTTREYILRDARKVYERLDHMDNRLNFLLELNTYSRNDRARILYNHLWHSEISSTCLREIGAGGYKKIIDHEGYNPRLIEYCTGGAFDVESSGYPERFKATLDHPERIWRAAFDKHLLEEHRLLTLVLCTLPRQVALEDLRDAYVSLCSRAGISNPGRSFRDALEVLESTFITIGRNADGKPAVSHANPSVTEFCLARIESDRELLRNILESAVFFEQLATLFRHGDGAAFFSGGRVRRSSRLSLLSAIDSERDLLLASMRRTFKSRSPEIEMVWQTGRGSFYTEPPGKFESRVNFFFQCLGRWGLDASAIEAEIAFVIHRWENGEGGKGDAIELIDEIESSSLTSTVNEQAFHALDAWLESTLNETEDWIHYAEFASRSGGLGPDVTDRFDRFMDEEFSRWSPSPPDLEQMKNIAENLGLDDLVSRIDEALEEDSREPDDEYHREASSEAEGSFHEVTEGELAELFGRLSND